MKYLFFALLTIFLINCQSSRQDKQDKQIETTDSVRIEKPPIVFKVTVDQLRFRSEPSLSAEVIGLLMEGDELTSLGDSTDFREKITLRDVEYYRPWFKVHSEVLDTVGWVYGGAIIPQIPLPGDIILKPGRLVFKLEKARGDNLQILFQIADIDPKSIFDGYYEYRLNQNDQRILDGSFRISNQWLIESYNQYAEISFEGRYKEGKKDGAFLRRTSFPESNSTETLYYEAKINDCIWGSLNGDAEGQKYSFREDNPTHCSYDYLREKAGMEELVIEN